MRRRVQVGHCGEESVYRNCLGCRTVTSWMVSGGSVAKTPPETLAHLASPSATDLLDPPFHKKVVKRTATGDEQPSEAPLRSEP